MPAFNELTIKQAAEGIRKQDFSVTDLTESCLSAAHEKNNELNAYVEIFDDAIKTAKERDVLLKEKLRQGETLPPLFGIPLAIKDNIMIEGKRTTAGSNILKNYRASYDATVIKKLKEQNAIFIGKTNLDEFAMGSSTEHSAFGATKNPHDTARVPGGSSGGSAAAVAADCCIAALGSDTGGSIRQPASFCGITGLKPTYGHVSRHGLIAMASSLDQVGPMTKSIADARVLYNAIRGRDAFDSTAQTETTTSNPQEKNIKDLRIGVPKEYFNEGLDKNVEARIKKTIKKLEDDGAQIKEISLPYSEYALATYYIVVPSEISSNLARFDGIRFGHQSDNAKNLLEVYERSRAEGFGTEVKRRIMLGTYTLSAGYYHAYYLKAQKVRQLIKDDFETAFQNVDLIISPTTPTPAFPFGEKTDPISMYLADIYTVAVNLAGIPALSMPVGYSEQDGTRLPIGLQLIGPHHSETRLFATAEHIEKSFV